jgi:subtilisin family serine protease
MSTKNHRLAAAAVSAVAACVLSVPIAGGALDSLKPGKQTLAPTFISPPPALHKQFHWFRWHPSTRALSTRSLQSRDRTFGSTAVIGLRSVADLNAVRKAYGLQQVIPIPRLHAVQVTVDRVQLNGLLAGALGDQRIRYVSPVPRRRLLHLQNDPLLQQVDPATGAPYEWQFAATHVDLALNLSHGSPNIVACTIDSGVADVPDLAGKVISRWVFDGQTPVLATGGTDDEGHGTATASLIAANVGDGIGMAGFGGATRIISFRDDDLADTSIAIAMTKLVSLGCRIISMSFGGPDPASPILKDAIDQAFNHGVLLIASAGNDGAGQPVIYPAADLQADDGAPSMGLAVGSSDFAGQPSSFSNTGSRLSLLAPGDYNDGCSGVLAAISVPSLDFDKSCWELPALNNGTAHYASVAGTSFSAPEVAGVAALVWAARPTLENWQVAEIIKRSARHDGADAWTPDRGFGVLDAAAALELATGRSSADALELADTHTARSDKWATVSGRVTWSNGDPATDATVTCSSGSLHSTTSLAQGAFKCTWRVTTAMASKAIRVSITAADPQIQTPASQVFTLGQPRVP